MIHPGESLDLGDGNKLVWMEIDELKTYFDPDNPNECDDPAMARLTDSIDQNGILGQFPVVNVANHKMIGGHHRVEGMELARISGTWTCVVNWPDEDRHIEAALSLNAQYGEFNEAKLKKQLAKLLEHERDLDNTHLPVYTIEDLFKEEPKWDGKESEDDFMSRMQTHTCPRCGHEFKDGTQ